MAYNDARDALLQSLTRNPGPEPRRGTAKEHHADVQALAELLWESAGRPTGTAEEDWRRAEEIVQCAIEDGQSSPALRK